MGQDRCTSNESLPYTKLYRDGHSSSPNENVLSTARERDDIAILVRGDIHMGIVPRYNRGIEATEHAVDSSSAHFRNSHVTRRAKVVVGEVDRAKRRIRVGPAVTV